ncbi:GDP-L-fucose synthase family protein [Chloroflexota bacterium]
MNKDSKIFVAGHTGLVGSAFVCHLKNEGYTRIITRSHSELDLTNQSRVKEFFFTERPDYVILAAGKVGGIMANSQYPAEFIYDNLQIYSNVIHNSWLTNIQKLLLIGSSCIYPKICPQPIREEYLLSGPLEPTSEPFATAKIAGIRLCQSYNRQYGTKFISLVSTNTYGPGDNFNPDTSHLVPGLINKFHEAKISGSPSVTLWGTGTPKREFIYVNDLATAGVFLLMNYDSSEIINVGVGEDKSVKEFAEMIAGIVGFDGEILFDNTKPDGAPRKLLDNTKIRNLGWCPGIDLETGIRATYSWYEKNVLQKSTRRKE